MIYSTTEMSQANKSDARVIAKTTMGEFNVGRRRVNILRWRSLLSVGQYRIGVSLKVFSMFRYSHKVLTVQDHPISIVT